MVSPRTELSPSGAAITTVVVGSSLVVGTVVVGVSVVGGTVVSGTEEDGGVDDDGVEEGGADEGGTDELDHGPFWGATGGAAWADPPRAKAITEAPMQPATVVANITRRCRGSDAIESDTLTSRLEPHGRYRRAAWEGWIPLLLRSTSDRLAGCASSSPAARSTIRVVWRPISPLRSDSSW